MSLGLTDDRPGYWCAHCAAMGLPERICWNEGEPNYVTEHNEPLCDACGLEIRAVYPEYNEENT